MSDSKLVLLSLRISNNDQSIESVRSEKRNRKL